MAQSDDGSLEEWLENERKKRTHTPNPMSVQDMKDSRGKSSSIKEDAKQPAKIRGGKRRSGTPSSPPVQEPQVEADGTPLQKVPGKRKAQPKPVMDAPTGQDSTRPGVGVTLPTVRKASGLNDLAVARLLRERVVTIMRSSPYKIPNDVAQQRVGDIDYAGGTAGTFDVERAMRFLSQHADHVAKYGKNSWMPHEWLPAPKQQPKTVADQVARRQARRQRRR